MVGIQGWTALPIYLIIQFIGVTSGGILRELTLPLFHLPREVPVFADGLVQVLLYAVVLGHFVGGGGVEEDVAQLCNWQLTHFN